MNDPGERLRTSLAADQASAGVEFDSPIAMEALRATRVLHAADQDPFPAPSRLRRAIEAYVASLPADKRPHYALIDCPPSLGLLTLNALVAGDEVLIPIQCEYYALEGLGQLLDNIDLVRAHLNPGIAVRTILLTMYDGRTKLADQVAEEVRNHFGDLVLHAVIPRNVRVSEAPGYGQSVLTYDPGSRGSTSYVEAARELAERGAALPPLDPGKAPAGVAPPGYGDLSASTDHSTENR